MSRIVYALCFILCLISAGTAQAETFRLVTAPFKPFADPKDPQGGFLVKVAREALALRGHKLEMEYRPWARAMAEAANQRFDGLLSAFYNNDRAEHFYFSAPINTTRMVFISLRDTFPTTVYHNLDDLIPYRIAIGRKWAYSAEFEQNKKLNKNVVNDEPSGIRMLFNKRIDLFAVNLDQFHYHIDHMDEYDISKTQVLEPSISVNDQHIAASINAPRSLYFLSEFNTGLAALKASGKYNDIRTSYFRF